jgi:hypothetical protein
MASLHFGIGEVDPSINVLHKCDVPTCFNPEHLFLGTQAINMQDASAKGRLANRPNWNLGRSKANKDEVRAMYQSGEVTMKEVGNRFGITATTVCRIVHS